MALKLPLPRIASATAHVVNGLVVGATITDGGSGYTNNPVVTFSAGGGSGATATATVVHGVLTSIQITHPGSGYTSAPEVILGLTLPAQLSIEVSKVQVRLVVVLGREYSLESSSDRKTWTPTGDSFVARASELIQEF